MQTSSKNSHAPTPPPPSTNPQTSQQTQQSASPTAIPSFLPVEDIYVQPQHQPPNPEDEDDVVPDQHAAFGITRAMERRREAVWRDLGLEALVNGEGHGGVLQHTGVGPAATGRRRGVWGLRRHCGLGRGVRRPLMLRLYGCGARGGRWGAEDNLFTLKGMGCGFMMSYYWGWVLHYGS
ncbi:hypothetical protein N7470_008793 [Penicillium chermesinum]|nr:hypothetical protein N7470_008793 [Penicillium chermesinum]